MIELAICGGTVVTAEGICKADIGIAGGVIVAIAPKIDEAQQRINAEGLLVLPGGIDSHVHIAQDSGPDVVMADDFASATAAAAAGGNTCVLSFALQKRGESLRASVEEYKAKAQGECYVDASFQGLCGHFYINTRFCNGPSRVNPSRPQSLAECLLLSAVDAWSLLYGVC